MLTQKAIRHMKRQQLSCRNLRKQCSGTWILNQQIEFSTLAAEMASSRTTTFQWTVVAYVLGIDASPSMIDHARKTYGSPGAEFYVVDCRYLERETSIANGSWDKVYGVLPLLMNTCITVP
jgi:hypothetical protein